MTMINSNTATRFLHMTGDDAVIGKALHSARNLLNLIEGRTPVGYAIRTLLEGEGFDSAVMRAEVTAALDLPLPETVAAITPASIAVDVRATIDAAVLAALDGINLREAIASLVEERVANADLDIEEMAKEVISDKADDLDMEDLAKEVISDLAGEIDMEELAKSAMEDNVDYADVVREVVDAKFSRTEIKHAIKEAITERLSKVQVSVTV